MWQNRVMATSRARILVGLGVFAMVASVPPAAAELVVLDDGHFFKVDDYRLEGASVTLELAGGGRVSLPLSRVERVVEDEIVPAVVATTPPEAPAFSLRFAAGQPVPSTPYGEEIWSAAQRHGLNPALVAAVVAAESAFDPNALSRVGARGLMQLMPATADRFGLRADEHFIPHRNLEAGSRYLAWLVERFGDDLALALAAYNAGEGTVDRYRGVPPYRETRTYLERIFRRLGLDEDAGR